MSKLIAVPMPSDVPCHMHNCYNPIAYKLVHPSYVETLGMEIALICADCARSLIESLRDATALDEVVHTDVLTRRVPGKLISPKRGRPKKNDVRPVRT